MLSEKRGQQVQTKTDIAITAKWVLARVYPELQWKNVNCNINCMWVARVYFFSQPCEKTGSIFHYSVRLIQAGNICFTTRQKDGAYLMFTTQRRWVSLLHHVKCQVCLGLYGNLLLAEDQFSSGGEMGRQCNKLSAVIQRLNSVVSLLFLATPDSPLTAPGV